jgi:hypothetical protein
MPSLCSGARRRTRSCAGRAPHAARLARRARAGDAGGGPGPGLQLGGDRQGAGPSAPGSPTPGQAAATATAGSGSDRARLRRGRDARAAGLAALLERSRAEARGSGGGRPRPEGGAGEDPGRAAGARRPRRRRPRPPPDALGRPQVWNPSSSRLRLRAGAAAQRPWRRRWLGGESHEGSTCGWRLRRKPFREAGAPRVREGEMSGRGTFRAGARRHPRIDPVVPVLYTLLFQQFSLRAPRRRAQDDFRTQRGDATVERQSG